MHLGIWYSKVIECLILSLAYRYLHIFLFVYYRCVCLCVCVCVWVAQLCLTLCGFMDCSPPGSFVHGILQEKILDCLPFPSPGDLPDPGIEPMSPALQVDSLPSEPSEKTDYGHTLKYCRYCSRSLHKNKYCNKASHTFFFGFQIKVMFTVYYSLLNVQIHVQKTCIP